MKGKLFVISAPSGTGKTTVIKNLMSRMPKLALSISATTRQPRGSEKNGTDYLFVSEAEFTKMISSGEMLEWANVHEHLYGTPKKPIEEWLKEGKNVLLDIDVQGAKSVKKHFKDAVLIFLLPPSREELIKRLKGRGANSEADLKIRIKNADKELAQKSFYDYNVVNDDLDRAVGEIAGIINNA